MCPSYSTDYDDDPRTDMGSDRGGPAVCSYLAVAPPVLSSRLVFPGPLSPVLFSCPMLFHGGSTVSPLCLHRRIAADVPGPMFHGKRCARHMTAG